MFRPITVWKKSALSKTVRSLLPALSRALMSSRARLWPLLKALALSNADGAHNSADAGEDAVFSLVIDYSLIL